MFCVSGVGSTISTDIFPRFDVSEGEWELGFVDLSTFNSIPNIRKDVNDKFLYGSSKEIVIPEGSYEVEDIEKFIKSNLEHGVEFSLKPNNNTLRVEISCSVNIDFKTANTIGSMLGFDSRTLEGGKSYVSDRSVRIIKVNTIVIECNVVRGSYTNGTESHVIHEFYPSVPPGYKIVEKPGEIIYLPLNVRVINNITVTFKDQDGDLVNFRDEIVTVRLHVRKRYGSSI